MARASLRGCVTIVAAALVAQCGGSEAGSGPGTNQPTLAVLAGNLQTGSAGQPLPQSIVVLVKNANGSPFSGADVHFRVLDGGGGLSDTSLMTGTQGTAAVQWTLGTVAGNANNHVHVRTSVAPGVTGVFTASVVAAAGDTIQLVAGDHQTGGAGQALASRVRVRLADAYGNLPANATVDWEVTSGGGSATPATTQTDVGGLTSTVWNLGPSLGAQSLIGTVHAAPLRQVAIHATAVHLLVSSIAPDTLIEGQVLTIAGEGFSPTATDDSVLVDGSRALGPPTAGSRLALDLTHRCR